MPRVRSVLEGAEAKRHTVYLSLINLGEVLYITERERGLVAARSRPRGSRAAPSGNRGSLTGDGIGGGSHQGRFPISYADAFAVVTARDRAALV